MKKTKQNKQGNNNLKKKSTTAHFLYTFIKLKKNIRRWTNAVWIDWMNLFLRWLLPAVSYGKAVAKPIDKETKAVVYLQPVLHLDDGAVQVGGGELRWDADHLGRCLSTGRCDGLHLLLQDVICVEPPSPLRKEAYLLIQDEFWLYCATWLVVDFHFHLHVFTFESRRHWTVTRVGGRLSWTFAAERVLTTFSFSAAFAFLKYSGFLCCHQIFAPELIWSDLI